MNLNVLNKMDIDSNLLLNVINRTGVGVVISNPRLKDNPIIYVNKGFEILTGYSAEDILGRNCRFLQGEKTNQSDVDKIRKAIQEERTCEVELLNYRKNGEEFWNELVITPIFSENGQLEHFIGIQKDATARKKAEETMHLYEKVFMNTLQGVIITDHTGNIILVNDAFTKTTGYTLQEIQGANPNILSSGKHDRLFYAQLWRELTESGQWEGEIWNRRKNGEIYPEFLNISEVRAEDGHLTNYVAVFTDITESKNREFRLAKLSVQDGLTGIANRRKFDDYLNEKWRFLAEVQEPISLILIDVDHFKLFNDYYGHQKGDDCLIQIAETLEQSVDRQGSLVARYGGEEFAIILPQCHVHQAMQIAESIKENIQFKKIPHANSTVAPYVTASIGVATLVPIQEHDATILIQKADQALYQAKNSGKNKVVNFDEELT